MHIANSVALVTGTNRGIGRAFVEVLLSVGARRVYATARNPALLEPLVALDQARIIPLKLDITNQQETQIRDRVHAHGCVAWIDGLRSASTSCERAFAG